MIRNQLIELRKNNQKAFCVLIDPDKVEDMSHVQAICHMSIENNVAFFLVGGSLITNNHLGPVIHTLKKHSETPVILFPGHSMHVDLQADAILFLSLISGRNPDLLIGQHVLTAPILKKSNLEVISTGYMLIESGSSTSASYMSGSLPLPAEKPAIAACTAMASEMLGHQAIYLDAGSGARHPVPRKMIHMVRQSVDVPLIVGGGLDRVEKVDIALQAGADLIVIGNSIENNPEFLIEVASCIGRYNRAPKYS